MMYAVWPTPVPPVPTGLWTQADWYRYERGYRPKGYLGGMYSQVAWELYTSERDEAFVRRFYAGYGFDAICNHMSAFFKENQ